MTDFLKGNIKVKGNGTWYPKICNFAEKHGKNLLLLSYTYRDGAVGKKSCPSSNIERQGILRDKTMDDKLMYIHNEDKQSYHN